MAIRPSPAVEEATTPASKPSLRPAWLWEVLVLAVILTAAAFLRFYRLAELPPGLDLDEARNGVEVLRVLAGSHPLFFTTFDPREPAFIYSLSLAVRGMGHTIMAMRVTGALWGLLGVALTYPLARQWFGRRVALLATAGMAGSLWDLAMSRWSERDITLLPPLLLFLFFLWRGFERRSTPSFVLAGLFASLCAYAYVAARILPLLILLLLASQWLLDRQSLIACRRGLLAGLAMAVATISPLGAYFALHREAFFGRIQHVSSLGPPPPGLAPESFWRTAANTLGMFFVRGDVNWRDDVAAQPVFWWWAAVPFCLGVLWALRHAFTPAKDVRPRLGEASPPAALYPCLWLILWQITLLVPAFLSRPSPQYDRTIGATPSTYILLALGLAVACHWLAAHRLGAAASVAAGALVVLLGLDTYRAYFRVYPVADQPRHVFEYGQVVDAAVLNQLRPAPERTFIYLGSQSGMAIRYLAPQYEPATWLEDFSQLILIPASGPATYAFAQPSLPSNGDLPAVLQRYFPEASILSKSSFLNGDQAGRMFEVGDAQLRQFEGARRRIDGNFGDVMRLDSINLSDAQLNARPGQEFRLGLSWTVMAPSHDNVSAFVHVVDGGGKVVAQDDRQGLPTNGWQPGQRFLSLHEFRVPADTPPGRYRVLAGVDRRTVDAQPSRSLGELGPQVQVLELVLS
ncbi:MAG TPA: glycosyltransferase family 39 protein [Chloroflexota bacterium]|nr:glycosyltransferase family 39 protein [Chloroflexota bacterium]